MAELTDTQRRESLDWIKDLAVFAESAPHFFAEHRLHQLVGELNKFYGYTRALKKIHIHRYIAKAGLVSKAEIVANWKWHKDIVSELVNELVDDGKIEECIPESAGSGSYGGRPATRYRIKNG